MFEMTGCESHSVLVGGRGEQESSLSLHDDAGGGTAEREADGYDGGPVLVSPLGLQVCRGLLLFRQQDVGRLLSCLLGFHIIQKDVL